jgi:Replication initiation factor
MGVNLSWCSDPGQGAHCMSKAITNALKRATVSRSAVDWLTTTARSHEASERLWDLGERIVTASKDKDQLPTRWHLHGYRGWQSDHCAFGARADGTYLRLSGDESSENWLEALTASENCSRIDLAVDVRLDAPMPSLSEQLYRKSPDRLEHGGRPPMRRLVQDTNGGTTCYFGSRSSSRFGRVYDKGRETQTVAAGNWWRWELEAKERDAKAAVAALLRAANPSEWIVGATSRFFKQRSGVALVRNTSTDFYKVEPEVPSGDRLLHWLSSGVRPAVARLIEHYGRDRVLTALGIPLQSAVKSPSPGSLPRDDQWLPQSARSTK